MNDANISAPFPLTEASGHFDSRPSVNTLRRWAGRGVRGVRLRTWLVGGRRHTSDEAIAQFLLALNAAPADARA